METRVDPIQRRLATAYQQHQMGRFEGALDGYRQVLLLDPQNADAHHLMGLAHFEAGDPRQAGKYVAEAAALRPEEPKIQANLGAILIELGLLEQAVTVYQNLVALDPRDPGHIKCLGVALDRQGDRDAAITAFRRAIELAPDHGQAHFALANALQDAGSLDQAIAHLIRAGEIDPAWFEARVNLGAAHNAAGRLEAAAEAYHAALAIRPDSARTHNDLANVVFAMGERDQAIALHEKALSLDPEIAEAHSDLAIAHLSMDRQDLAIGHLREAIRLRPDLVAALNNLASVLNSLFRFAEAESAYRNALAITPDSPEINFHFARFLRHRGRDAEAVPQYRKAVALAPGDPLMLSELGLALTFVGVDEEAERLMNQAQEMAPDDMMVLNNNGLAYINMRRFGDAEALYRGGAARYPDTAIMFTNLGNVLFYQGRGRQGVPYLRRALELNADEVETHLNLAHALLGNGDLEEGWREYEWRHQKAEVHVPYEGPYWDGSDLDGKTILVWREQGIADEILFSSCCPDVIATARRVLIECDQRLAPIYRRSFPGAMVHGLTRDEHIGGRREAARYDWNRQFEPIDSYISLGGLGRYLRPTVTSFPDRPEGWLRPDPALSAAWAERLAALGPEPKVGICWRSSVMNPQRAHTVSPLSDWGALLRVPGVRFINLQYDRCGDELRAAEARWGIEIHDFEDLDQYNDLDETFAMMSGLDLAVCGGVAPGEMCAAIGLQTWRVFPEWEDYIGLGTGGSPWTPNSRHFHRDRDGDWTDVLQAIADQLARWISHRSTAD